MRLSLRHAGAMISPSRRRAPARGGVACILSWPDCWSAWSCCRKRSLRMSRRVFSPMKSARPPARALHPSRRKPRAAVRRIPISRAAIIGMSAVSSARRSSPRRRRWRFCPPPFCPARRRGSRRAGRRGRCRSGVSEAIPTSLRGPALRPPDLFVSRVPAPLRAGRRRASHSIAALSTRPPDPSVRAPSCALVRKKRHDFAIICCAARERSRFFWRRRPCARRKSCPISTFPAPRALR